jgi:hypothetical protein
VEAANRHHFKRARWRRLWRQQIQDWLIAAAQNIAILGREQGAGAAARRRKPVGPARTGSFGRRRRPVSSANRRGFRLGLQRIARSHALPYPFAPYLSP